MPKVSYEKDLDKGSQALEAMCGLSANYTASFADHKLAEDQHLQLPMFHKSTLGL